MYPIIEAFNIKISSYLLTSVLGCAIAFLLYFFCTRRYFKCDKFDALMLFFCGLFGAFIGSKMLYIIVEWDRISSSSNTIAAAFSNGGFVFYGGLLGGMLLTYIYCKKSDISWLSFASSICAPLCLGHAIGRIGCFLAGCCYGCETDLPIGVKYPSGSIAPSGVKLLPTQLMESAFLFLLCIYLLIILKKKKSINPCAVYFIAYGIWRFIIEYFRSDSRGSIFFLSTSQFLSIFIIAAGLAIIIQPNKSNGIKQDIYR